VGKVDAIVVYKLDRLSRSILDFSQLMETLERCQVSFVSVTELFNTQTPSGRMVLNMLANFAQFEREVIAERTRDKMGAARRRGRWVGGMPVLGYDVAPEGGRLLVNEAEAEPSRPESITTVWKLEVTWKRGPWLFLGEGSGPTLTLYVSRWSRLTRL
jgi:site-specific DNA recombinase